MHASFDRKYLAASAVTLACLLALVVLGVMTTARLRDSEAGADSARDLQTRIRSVYTSLLELESSERGYLLTLNPAYLEPVEHSAARLDAALGALAALSAKHPDQAADLGQIASLASARRAEVLRTAELARTQGAAAALERVRSGEDKAPMDAIRATIASLEGEESRGLAQLEAAEAASIAGATRFAAILGAAMTVLLGAIHWLVRRERALRERADRTEADAMALLERRVEERTAALEQTARALDVSEARLRRLLTLLPEAVLVYGGERISFVNEAAQRLLGAGEAALLGRSPLELIHPDSVALVESRLQALRHGAAVAPLTEEKILRADGTTRVVEATTTLIDDHGEMSILSVLRDVTELRQVQAALENSHAALQRLVASQDKVQEDERKRIARELHDDLQQTLAAIRIDLFAIGQRIAADPQSVAPLLAEIDELAATAIDSTRRIVNDLRPQMLEELGLVPALEVLAGQFTRRTGIECRFKADDAAGESVLQSPALTTCLYRVTQEALNNAARHAQADLVQISLAQAADGAVVLRVADNGSGMTPGDRHKLNSFGLLGMHERVRALGGALRVDSRPGAGTKVEVVVPLAGPHS